MSPNVSVFSIHFLEIILSPSFFLSFSAAAYWPQELMVKNFLHECCPHVSDLNPLKSDPMCLSAC